MHKIKLYVKVGMYGCADKDFLLLLVCTVIQEMRVTFFVHIIPIYMILSDFVQRRGHLHFSASCYDGIIIISLSSSSYRFRCLQHICTQYSTQKKKNLQPAIPHIILCECNRLWSNFNFILCYHMANNGSLVKIFSHGVDFIYMRG